MVKASRLWVAALLIGLLAWGLGGEPASADQLAAWGAYEDGQCNVPSGTDYVAVAGGVGHSLAVRSDGTVVAWGRNSEGQCNTPPGNDHDAIAAGSWHSLALRSDGTIVAWGWGDYGQCDAPAGNNHVAIAGGAWHSLALRSDGTVVAWGNNYYGQCNVPLDSGYVAIAGGIAHNLALKSDGTVAAWGDNEFGQCNVPGTLTGVVAIAAGSGHSLALRSDGTVVAWGDDYFGQCNVPLDSGYVAIAAGALHSLALKSDGTVVAWGYNGSGQCTVPGTLTAVSAIAAGAYHSLACFGVSALPVADAGGPYVVAEGGAVALDASGTTHPGQDPATLLYEWDFDADGQYDDATGIHPTFSAAELGGPASVTVGLKVTDGQGGSDTDTATVTITNQPPSITVVEATVDVDEGTTATNSGSFSDPGGDAVTLSASVGAVMDNGGGTWTWSFGTSDGPSESQTVTIMATDSDQAAASVAFGLTVNNVAPAVGLITAPLDPVQVSTGIEASADFTDPGVADTHTATWDWGDGSGPLAGTVSETGGSGSATGTHAYTTAGVYTLTLTVTDNDGASGDSVFQYVVIYNPSGGFVTGGGWIMSPPGAYAPAPTLTGKANFGFVSKYKKGADIPEGQTDFHFRVADLHFHSLVYQWLVVAGSKAKFKGIGTINGTGLYGFMVTAADGKDGLPDTFRIKIWDLEEEEELVYDNQKDAADDAYVGTELGGGSIVVHEDK